MVTFWTLIYEGEQRYSWTLGNDKGYQVWLPLYWLNQLVCMGCVQAADIESIVAEYWTGEREPIFRILSRPAILTGFDIGPSFRTDTADYDDAPGGYGFNGEQSFEQWQTEQWERSGQ
mgnify:CR=1 FL=1